MTDDGPPILGGSALFGVARDLRRDQLGTYRRALEDHGGGLVRFHLGPPKVGIEFDTVFTPEDARQVLATDNAHYDKQVAAFDEFRLVMGDGLVTSEGDRWRRDRRTVAPLFTKKRVASYVPVMVDAAERMTEPWGEGGEVDIEGAGRRFAFDVLGRAVFGGDVEAAAPLLETIPFLSAYVTRRALSVVRTPASLPTPVNRRAAAARKRWFDFIDALITRRKAGALDGDDLVTHLLAVRDPETGEPLGDDVVRDQAITFLIAGHETTGSAVTFALHLLARHPEVQQRVRDEVAAVGGDVERLVFTTQVVDETLRLYPIAHTVVRHGVDATTVAGHDAPAGRIVAVSIWGIHHNPDVWPDPYRYDPDRFATPPAERYAHLPFGGGPRGCIGQNMAMDELVVAVATVVRRFELQAPANAEPSVVVGATIRPPAPLMVRARMVPTVSRPGGRGPETG